MSKSGITESWGSCTPRFLRNCWAGFHSGCTSWKFHHQWMSVPLIPYPYKHMLPLFYQSNMKSHSSFDLHFFDGKGVQFFSIFLNSLSFSFEYPILNWLICLFDFYFFSYSYILDSSLLSDIQLVKFFFYSLTWHLVRTIMSYHIQKLFRFLRSP